MVSLTLLNCFCHPQQGCFLGFSLLTKMFKKMTSLKFVSFNTLLSRYWLLFTCRFERKIIRCCSFSRISPSKVAPVLKPSNTSPRQYDSMVISPQPGSQQYNYGAQQFHQRSPQQMQMGGNQHRSPQQGAGSPFGGSRQMSPRQMQAAGYQHTSPQQMVGAQFGGSQMSPQQMQMGSGHHGSPQQMQMVANQISPQHRSVVLHVLTSTLPTDCLVKLQGRVETGIGALTSRERKKHL